MSETAINDASVDHDGSRAPASGGGCGEVSGAWTSSVMSRAPSVKTSRVAGSRETRAAAARRLSVGRAMDTCLACASCASARATWRARRDYFFDFFYFFLAAI